MLNQQLIIIDITFKTLSTTFERWTTNSSCEEAFHDFLNMLLTGIVYLSYFLKELLHHSLIKMMFEDVFTAVNSGDESELCDLSPLSEISSELDLDQVMSLSPITDEEDENRLDFLEGWLNSTSRLQYSAMAEFFLGGVPAIKNFGNSPLTEIGGREKTFEGKWSPSMLLSGHQLAYNGFFFQNYPDEVTCYFCGLTMRSLNPGLVNQLEEFHFHNSMALNFEVPCELANERLKEKQTREAQLLTNSWLPTLNSVQPEVVQEAQLTSVPGEQLTASDIRGGDGETHSLPSTCRAVSLIPGVGERGSDINGGGGGISGGGGSGGGGSGGGGSGGISGASEPWNPWNPWGQGAGWSMFSFGGGAEQAGAPNTTVISGSTTTFGIGNGDSGHRPRPSSPNDLIAVAGNGHNP